MRILVCLPYLSGYLFWSRCSCATTRSICLSEAGSEIWTYILAEIFRLWKICNVGYNPFIRCQSTRSRDAHLHRRSALTQLKKSDFVKMETVCSRSKYIWSRFRQEMRWILNFEIMDVLQTIYFNIQKFLRGIHFLTRLLLRGSVGH